jgi:hypothetical protein
MAAPTQANEVSLVVRAALVLRHEVVYLARRLTAARAGVLVPHQNPLANLPPRVAVAALGDAQPVDPPVPLVDLAAARPQDRVSRTAGVTAWGSRTPGAHRPDRVTQRGKLTVSATPRESFAGAFDKIDARLSSIVLGTTAQ